MTLSTLDYEYIASQLLDFFPNHLSIDTTCLLNDAVADCAFEDQDIETYGEDDPESISRYQSRHAESINEQGHHEQIVYLLYQGMTPKEVVGILAQGQGLTSHQKIALLNLDVVVDDFEAPDK